MKRNLLLSMVVSLIGGVVIVALMATNRTSKGNLMESSTHPQAALVGSGSQANYSADPDQTASGESPLYPEVVQAASKIGKSIPNTLQFVTHIRNVSYDGALRGPRGALLAGSGNSVDKALLLRDLLRSSSPHLQTRFATCTLAPDEAERPTSGAQVTSDSSRANAKAVATAAGTTAQAATTAPNETVEAMISSWQQHVDMVKRDAGLLQETLRQQGVTLVSHATTSSQLIDAAHSHAWLQYRQNSAWVDLDPTIGRGEVGKTLCGAQAVFSELPETFYHHLDINVLVEEREKGEVAVSSLLETAWRTADLTGSSITYIQAEPFGISTPPNASAATPPAGMSRYTPVLIVDRERISGASFYLPSVTSDQGKPMGAIVGGQVGDILGGHHIGAIGLQPKPALPPKEVIGIWLQFAIAPPHGPVQVYERPVIDRIGYAARADGKRGIAAAAPIQVADNEYVPMESVWSVAIWTGEKDSLVSKVLSHTSRIRDLWSAFGTLGSANRSYYSVRSSLFQLSRNASDTQLSYAGPDVSLFRWTPTPPSNAGLFAFDRVASNVNPTSSQAKWSSNVFLWAEASLESERLLVADSLRFFEKHEAAQRKDELSAGNVANIFAHARQADIPTLLLRPTELNRVETIGASDDARARIRSCLTQGKLVLTPARAIDISGHRVTGWWSIDRSNGSVIDEMENGSHMAQVAQEYPAQVKQSEEETTTLLEKFRGKFARGVCLLGGAAAGLMIMGHAYIDMKEGAVAEIPQEFQELKHVGEGIAKCLEEEEGEGGVPVGPVGENDPGEPLPHNRYYPHAPKITISSGIKISGIPSE